MLSLWNLLFTIFVLFPFLTGGWWLRAENFHLELTQGGPGLAVLSILYGWQVYRGRWRLDASYYFRFFRKVLLAWHSWLVRWETRGLIPVWIFFSFLSFGISLRRHQAFESNSADFGIFTNALWNLTFDGSPISSIKNEVNLLADHQNYLIYCLKPLFYLFPSAGILFFLQSFAMGAGGIAVFLLARQYEKRVSPLVSVIPLAYWLYLPLRNALRFDFHPELFMLPLFFFGIYFSQEKSKPKKYLGAVFLLLALLAKESAAPVAFALGLSWIIGSAPEEAKLFTRKIGFALLPLSLGVLYFNTSIVSKSFGLTYAYSGVYGDLGKSIFEVLLSPLTKPLLFIATVFGISRIKFLFGMAAPLGFFSFLAPRSFLVATPAMLILFLTEGMQRVSLGFHYALEPAIGFFFALAASTQTGLLKKFPLRAAAFLLLCSAIFSGRNDIYYWRSFSATERQQVLRTDFLPQLKTETSLSTNSSLVPHLAFRKWVQFLPIVQKKDGSLVDCVVWDATMNSAPMTLHDEDKLNDFLPKNFDLEFRCGTIRIFRSKEMAKKTASCFYKHPKCPEEWNR